jgi:hypothetical protein
MSKKSDSDFLWRTRRASGALKMQRILMPKKTAANRLLDARRLNYGKIYRP